MAGNVATQLVVTGEVDGEAALRAGLAGGFAAGVDAWAKTGISDATERWAVERLADGVAGEIREQSFAEALRWGVVDSAGATAANMIGYGLAGDAGTLTHTLAHGALGALIAEAKGMDPAAGAIGGITSDIVAPLIDEGTQLSGQDRYAAVTALDMLTAGLVSHAAGHDATTAAMTAQNEVLNNFLTPKQLLQVEQAMSDCSGDSLCESQVRDSARSLSANQDMILTVDKIKCFFGSCDAYKSEITWLKTLYDPPVVVQDIRTLHPDWSAEQVAGKATAYLTEAKSSLDAATSRTIFGTVEVVGAVAAAVGAIGSATQTAREALEQGQTAILKNGYYEVNGLKFSKIYYTKLWSTGRGAPSLVANEILASGAKGVPDALKAGFFRYEAGGWEMVYNPVTKEVWHLQPLK